MQRKMFEAGTLVLLVYGAPLIVSRYWPAGVVAWALAFILGRVADRLRVSR